MFTYFHTYIPETWEALVKHGFIDENSGVRFCDNCVQKDELRFNKLAAKGTKLYNIIKNTKMPLYIDRLQGGCFYEEYDFDSTYELVHQSDILHAAYLSAVGRGKRKLPPSTAPFTKIVAKKIVSVSTKIIFVIRNLFKGGKTKLTNLYQTANSRSELVATFLAVLELCKANRVKIEGDNDNAEITLIKGHKKR